MPTDRSGQAIHAARAQPAAASRSQHGSNETAWEVINPKGSHAVAAGVDAPVTVDVAAASAIIAAA